MAALATLRSISGNLDRTQQQISSGMRVATAADNAAYWSIATTMRSDRAAMSAASDSIGLGKAVLDVAFTGMDQIREELTTIRELVLTASSLPRVNGLAFIVYAPNDIRDPVYEQSTVAKVDGEIMQHLQQITSVVESSSFSGVNLLKSAQGTPLSDQTTAFTTGYTGGKVHKMSVDLKDTVMINYSRTSNDYYGDPGSENNGFLDGMLNISGIVNGQPAYAPSINMLTWYNGTEVVQNASPYFLRDLEASGSNRQGSYSLLIDQLDQRIKAVTSGMAVVGSAQRRLDIQAEFNKRSMDAITSGAGRLVDADMHEASIRLKALQTQEQLALSGLQIANFRPEAILQLFR